MLLRFLERRGVTLFLSIILPACFWADACAYTLSSDEMLRLLGKRYGAGENLTVHQKLIFYTDGLKECPVELDERLIYSIPNYFRSDIVSRTISRIHVVAREERVTVMDGEVETNGETSFDRYKDILLLRKKELLARRLTRLGLDLSVSSLGRFKNRSVYILGAEYPDETRPQLWMDKKTLLPVRWLTPDKGETGSLLEIVYHDWKKAGKALYPMRIEFFQEGLLVREIRVSRIESGQRYSGDLFNIGLLKSVSLQKPGEQPGRESFFLQEVNNTIEEFRKMYE